MNWKNYYKLPLKLECGYAWGKDGGMALTFDYDSKNTDSIAIIDAINGTEHDKFIITDLTYDGVDFYQNGKYIFCVRGWGNLTGIGGHNFSPKKASQIQDEFVKHIFNQLTE